MQVFKIRPVTRIRYRDNLQDLADMEKVAEVTGIE
jgi:hypothetical protein